MSSTLPPASIRDGALPLSFEGNLGAEHDTAPPVPRMSRVSARGKFLWAGDEKFFVKGVTYGTFRPDQHGEEFHDRDRVKADFSAMARQGINAVRTYTPPPMWLLAARRHAATRSGRAAPGAIAARPDPAGI